MAYCVLSGLRDSRALLTPTESLLLFPEALTKCSNI